MQVFPDLHKQINPEKSCLSAATRMKGPRIVFRDCLVAHTLKIKYREAESVALFHVETLIKAAAML